MNKRTSGAALLFRAAVTAMGTILVLCFLVGTAQATTGTTLDSGTSLVNSGVLPPLVVYTNANESINPGSATVEADFIDFGSEIDYEANNIAVPDGNVSGCKKTVGHISCEASNLAHGEHTMKVTVKDKYGSLSEKEGKFTVRDKVAPVIDSIVATTGSVTVKYHDPSPSSGIASIVVTVDGKKLNCCSTDSSRVGERDDDDHYSDSFSHLSSDCTILGHSYCGAGEGNDDLEREHSSGSVGFTCPILQTLSCGIHQVDVTVTDKAGNTTTSHAVIDSGDCTPPVTTDNAPGGWQNTDVNVSLTCTDTGSGCATTTYEVDGGATQTGNAVSLTTDGIHTITYRSKDVAGNVETTRTVTVKIDKTPPVVSTSGNQTLEATGPLGSTASFTASATDVTSGTTGASCALPSGSTFPIGTNVVTCSATDAAGNTGSAKLKIIVQDTTAPVLSLPAGIITEGTIGTGAVVDFTASATDTVDGTDAVSCMPPSGSTFPAGTTDVSCSATDSHGNTATGIFSITVFFTAPTLSLPADITTEATGLTGAIVSYDVTATDPDDAVASQSCWLPSGSTFPIGATTVHCSATDTHGNSNSGDFKVTVVDTTAPVVAYSGPSNTIYTSQDPTITGTATDAVGVTSASASIDGAPAIPCTVVAGDVSCPTSNVAYGSHSVAITATDAAGNIGTANGIFCKSSGRPNLMLYKVKGPYLVSGDPYRWVTVDYRMDNTGPNAYDVNMLSMTANNGIYLISPSLPPILGNIASGGSASFSVKYYYPVGTTSYVFTNTACAYDQCATYYTYP